MVLWSDLVEPENSARTLDRVTKPEEVSPATIISHHQVSVLGDTLNAALKLLVQAQDEGDWEDESEELESRDRVISKTEFGAMGEGENMKFQALVESERIL